jgi:small subunit ribosomal protein S16
MLKIRLARTGRTNDASYRLIVTPHTNKPQTHKSVEVLGTVDIKKGNYTFNTERVKYWLGVGAQVSGTVKNMLIDKKIINSPKARTQIKKVKKEGKKK